MELIEIILVSIAGAFLFFIAFLLILKMVRGEIDITALICEDKSTDPAASEAPGKASMSRFQLLVWTMVIGFAFLFLVIKNTEFPQMGNVLALLGISGGTYVVSKGIQKSKPSGK